MVAHRINRKLARTVAWSTTMETATYGMEFIYEGQQWVVGKVQTVNVRIAKGIAGLGATKAGCDATRSTDVPLTRAMLDRRTERHFLRLIPQKNTNSNLIPDEPDDILDDEDLPTLDRWTERAAYDLWTLRNEVETSTLTMIDFAPWHEQPLDCGLDQNSVQYHGYTDGSLVLPLGLGRHSGNQRAMEKKRRLPGIRDVWENLKLRLMVK
jgi:hypothetical protein